MLVSVLKDLLLAQASTNISGKALEVASTTVTHVRHIELVHGYRIPPSPVLPAKDIWGMARR